MPINYKDIIKLLICFVQVLCFRQIYSQKLIVEENEDIKIDYVYYRDPMTGENKNIIIDTNKLKLGTIISVISRSNVIENFSDGMIVIGSNILDTILFSIYIPNSLGITYNVGHIVVDSCNFIYDFSNADIMLSNFHSILKYDKNAINEISSYNLSDNQIGLIGDGNITYKLGDLLRINCNQCIRFK